MLDRQIAKLNVSPMFTVYVSVQSSEWSLLFLNVNRIRRLAASHGSVVDSDFCIWSVKLSATHTRRSTNIVSSVIPVASPIHVPSSTALVATEAGLGLEEGLLLVPTKLQQKMLKLEFAGNVSKVGRLSSRTPPPATKANGSDNRHAPVGAMFRVFGGGTL